MLSSKQPVSGEGTGTPYDAERQLRIEWWMNHGCENPNLYGDDGEFQCNVYHETPTHRSFIDFKRMPLAELAEVVAYLRMVKVAKALQEPKPGEGTGTRYEAKLLGENLPESLQLLQQVYLAADVDKKYAWLTTCGKCGFVSNGQPDTCERCTLADLRRQVEALEAEMRTLAMDLDSHSININDGATAKMAVRIERCADALQTLKEKLK